MENATHNQQDGPWPALAILVLGILAVTLAMLLEQILSYTIRAVSDKRLELPLIGLIYLLVIFAVPLANWEIMSRKFKIMLHLLLCILTLSLYTWLADTSGSPAPTNEAFRIVNDLNLGILVVVTLYLIAVTVIDAYLFRNDRKPFRSLSQRTGILYLAVIVFGWLSTLWGVNYFSAKFGACKFPPAYLHFQKQDQDALPATGFITERDLGCEYLRQDSPIDYLIDGEWAYQAKKLSFDYFLYDSFHAGKYSNGMETYFYSYRNLDIYQFAWFQKDELSGSDIQKVLDLDYFQTTLRPGEVELPFTDLPGPEYQQHLCVKNKTGVFCTIVLAYKHVIVGFNIIAPENAFKSIPNAILELNRRLLEFDPRVPASLTAVTTMKQQGQVAVFIP